VPLPVLQVSRALLLIEQVPLDLEPDLVLGQLGPPRAAASMI